MNGPKPLAIFDEKRAEYPNLPPKRVNPNNEPFGPFTGRCGRCQANDLWDDCTAYGCDNCGAAFSQ